MSLATLLNELNQAKGPVTGIELADRLGISTAKVAAMLDALRASGRLGPEASHRAPADSCSSAGTCSLRCPGPGECALTVDLNVTGLQIRSVR